MSQAEIIQTLEKKNEPMALCELAKEMEQPAKKISMSLKQMIKYNEVSFIEIDRRLARKFYNSKRRMKLYYL